MLPTLRRTQNWWPSLFNEFFNNDGLEEIVERLLLHQRDRKRKRLQS